MNSSVWNQYQWLHNTDQLTGFNFDAIRYFGSRWGVLSVICSGSGSCPSSGVSTDYVNNSLVTLAGPSGALTRALKLAFMGSQPEFVLPASGTQFHGLHCCRAELLHAGVDEAEP